MFKPSLFCLTFFLFGESLYAQTATPSLKMDTLTVHLQQVAGIGPGGFYSVGLSSKDHAPDDEQFKSYPDLKSIPVSISDVKSFFQPVDLFQYTFQNYVAGKISKNYFLEHAKFYGWKLADTIHLSKQNLKSGIALITGFDENKKEVYMVDETQLSEQIIYKKGP